MYHATKSPVTVPLAKNVKKGTLRKILRDAELESAEFGSLLRKQGPSCSVPRSWEGTAAIFLRNKKPAPKGGFSFGFLYT